MNHPFFHNRRLLLIYIAIWVVITAVHVFIVESADHFDFNIALADGIIFNVLFAALGLPVWFVVAYVKHHKSVIINNIINHLTAITIIEVIWISIGTAILRSFDFGKGYDTLLEGSISWRVISGFFYYSIIVLIYYIIIYYKDLREREQRESRLNELIKQSELDNLRSQINPHFLFNALNSISSLTTTSPEKAQEMIIKLSDFLRYSITHQGNALTDVASELANTKRYLDIEQVRFGKRLAQEFIVNEDCMNAALPSMILQPLFENAVKHGVHESTETITISTNINCHNNALHIIVSNNYDPSARPRKGAGIGIKNIRERLRLIYFSDQLLSITNKNSTYTVDLIIPQKIQSL